MTSDLIKVKDFCFYESENSNINKNNAIGTPQTNDLNTSNIKPLPKTKPTATIKKELSFSEILQKNIDKHNARIKKSQEFMKKYANEKGQVNIMDLMKK